MKIKTLFRCKDCGLELKYDHNKPVGERLTILGVPEETACDHCNDLSYTIGRCRELEDRIKRIDTLMDDFSKLLKNPRTF